MAEKPNPKSAPRRDIEEQANEGEGNRTAARRYNKATTEFSESGRVKSSAEEAERDFESPEERQKLEQAEREGRRKAREEDPEVVRDESRPARVPPEK